MVLVGFDKQYITPALPVALSGYAGKRIATGVHDELYTRCIALQCNGEYYVLAQCDCIAVDDSLRLAVLDALQEIPLKNEHFILAATHTHSGPAGTIDTSVQPFSGLQGVFGAPDPSYQKKLAQKIALAISNALKDPLECTITVGNGYIQGVGSERHDPSLPGDPSLFTLLFERSDGKTALLYNYACHPTVLNPENLLITADFPYAAESRLSYDFTMFVNSNAGDISTRFTRTSSSYEQAEHYGKIISESIQNTLKNPEYSGPLTQINIKQYPLTLPVKKLPSADFQRKQLQQYEEQLAKGQDLKLPPKELRVLASYVEGAKVSLELSESLQGLEKIPTHFSVITLQGFHIATIPGELFSTLGIRLKEQNIQVFGYTNGYYMYLADTEAYDSFYYEAMSSPFERGTGEYLIKEILDVIL